MQYSSLASNNHFCTSTYTKNVSIHFLHWLCRTAKCITICHINILNSLGRLITGICYVLKLLNAVITTRQRSCRKVIFQLCLSISQSVRPWGSPHVTITHDALDLTVQALGPLQTGYMDSPSPGRSPPPGTGYLDPQSQPHLTASDIWWSSLGTCWNVYIGPYSLLVIIANSFECESLNGVS